MRKLQELNRFDFAYSSNYIIWYMFNLKCKECDVCHLQSTIKNNFNLYRFYSTSRNYFRPTAGPAPAHSSHIKASFDECLVSANVKEFGLQMPETETIKTRQDNQFFQHNAAAAVFENMFLVVHHPLVCKKWSRSDHRENASKIGYERKSASGWGPDFPEAH